MRETLQVIVAVAVLTWTPLAFAATVKCPDHAWAYCHETGATKMAGDGGILHKYDCTCGDSLWVR
jgi:hypothetical protein